jgi:valine--pyruvate aminotransferase
MKFSRFGEKFARHSGIVELMDDLGSAQLENPDMIMMGGGNPGRVKAAETVFRRCLETVMNDPERRHRLFGLYQSPHGDQAFRSDLAKFLRNRFGWRLSPANIAIANGSQSAFFILFNLLAGQMPDGGERVIKLPLTPEYLGYADSGLGERFFSATRPGIERLEDGLFKYRVDFSRLDIGDTCGALCVSRPTNPTGNVLTDDELAHLDDLARAQGIPLIIDGAYGPPFPNILFTEAAPLWNENVILTLSLSKLGLPGVRTGIVIAREEIIDAYANANGIVNLAWPFYAQRAAKAVRSVRESMGGLPCRIHKPEGAFFLWLWFERLPVTSQVLYKRLKQRGVLVVPGHHCFFGLDADWPHRHECIRVSYVQDEEVVRRGIALIADEVRELY